VQLAEGQKGAKVEHECPLATPPASQLELAEWVKSLERNARFADFLALFGGGGVLAGSHEQPAF
jgi:hypothetical protein